MQIREWYKALKQNQNLKKKWMNIVTLQLNEVDEAIINAI